MSETKRTLSFVGAAALLLLLVVATAPRTVTPDAFSDQGEPFFPEFTDPNEAITLEVIEFDEDTAAARPFKVTFQEGRWTIPSHHDYPADGKDRLAETAAGVLELRKDDFRSNNAADHEACGVLDPLDDAITSLKGRGKRVTIKGTNDKVLADLIIGREVEGRDNLRFVRVPGQKRIYVSRADLEISTAFEDWIERDLLQVDKEKIDRVVLKNYSINERTGQIVKRDEIPLDKSGDSWKTDRMRANQEVDTVKVNDLLRALDELSIVGVRPKPEGLSASLQRSEGEIRISQADLLSLQSKGYYFSRDGQLLSNEGEVEVQTSDGLVYTLRFGEIVYGSGEALTAGTEASDDRKSGPGENRYLFLTATFEPKRLPEPPKPADTGFEGKPEEELSEADKRNRDLKRKHDEWKAKVEEVQQKADELSSRFADWYYVIAGERFEKLRLERNDLLKSKS